MNVRMLLVAVLLSILTLLLMAQGGSTGTILGIAASKSGAVIPGAEVDLTNVGTSVITYVETSSAGEFTAPYLPADTYRIVVQLPGFQRFAVDSIQLAVA